MFNFTQRFYKITVVMLFLFLFSFQQGYSPTVTQNDVSTILEFGSDTPQEKETVNFQYSCQPFFIDDIIIRACIPSINTFYIK